MSKNIFDQYRLAADLVRQNDGLKSQDIYRIAVAKNLDVSYEAIRNTKVALDAYEAGGYGPAMEVLLKRAESKNPCGIGKKTLSTCAKKLDAMGIKKRKPRIKKETDAPVETPEVVETTETTETVEQTASSSEDLLKAVTDQAEKIEEIFFEIQELETAVSDLAETISGIEKLLDQIDQKVGKKKLSLF